MNLLPRIFQINVSDGGVPKRPITTGDVTVFGLKGDRQRDTEHHGGPLRALCLFPLEHILALQAEGHPIFPGSVGENITVTGLPWTEINPGVRLWLGRDVEIEIVSFASPCRNIQGSFAGYEFRRISPKTQPGWARAYARVLHPGQIVIGDVVRLVAPTE